MSLIIETEAEMNLSRILQNDYNIVSAFSARSNMYGKDNYDSDISPCKEISEAEEIIRFHVEDTGCRWGIISKSEEQFVGTCGFHCWVQGGEQSKAEIGFDLGKEHWGKGLMQEVLRPVIAFGFNHMGLDLIEATVDPENVRSIKLLERLAFQREHELRDQLIYYYLRRESWET
ncbi:GCN5-related N-acetyltransferase [Paenibacillus curdlanolyticus YK9]|uniref:GCN5-related N-acetyltransferase n=1 Tax=Paenibacillus curdlanolyticus YK9 TaxID=717606 RepID=E0I7H3_9BACL|nr:GNAT family protein [Paenibacillus curdlanolyticus]EFM11989.1 GCN5-related N-acetyltransferase [Paenibacillus curdlanolyticus YK9]